MLLLIYGAIALIPLLLNFAASRSDLCRFVDAVTLSAMLCVMWAFTTIAAQIWPFPESKQFHPLLDLIGLTAALAAYATQRAAWKLGLAALFLAQLVAHAAFWWMRLNHPLPGMGFAYILALNVLWIGMIGCLSMSGGAHVLRRSLDWLRHHRVRPFLARG